MHTKKTILITNDDGITAPGIRALVEAVQDLAEIIVVAPDRPQSGMGHAITIGEPLRMNEVNIFEGVKAYQTTGTPADCVKLAKSVVLHRKPDLCISGINHGSNASINILYSGTMSAAMEAALEGIPAIGFSLLDFSHHADFSLAKQVAHILSKKVLEEGLPPHTLLNVNIPKCTIQEHKGMKICKQGNGSWNENFDTRKDPRGVEYHWMVGSFVHKDQDADSDINVLDQNYTSIVPIQYDLTHYKLKEELSNSWRDVLA
ncbi:MAG: 5/3-nucleotidase SurE [Bacteroidota bacterium]|jgi:5'-nucleotidase